MKTIYYGVMAVVCLIFIFGCSKENVTSPVSTVASASSIDDAKTQIVGRQKVITLKTGDYYYPTSKALLWLPNDYDKANAKGYPLLICLGGVGQNGSSDINVLLNTETVAKRIANGWNADAINPVNGKKYKFIVFISYSSRFTIQSSRFAFSSPSP